METSICTPLTPIHRKALAWFSAHANKEVGWPSPMEGFYLANKAKGIHKPAGSDYVLSVRQSLGGPYQNSVSRLADGSWQFFYAQEGIDPSYFTNQALMACMRDNVPVGVLLQIDSKPNVRYLVLGLGQVIDWNGGIFTICEYRQAEETQDANVSEAVIETFGIVDERDARLHTLRAIAIRQGQQRFRSELIRAYRGICAVSGCEVVHTLEAAHILPYRGEHTNQLQNGLLLRADLHTLFDLGMFDIDPESLVTRFNPLIREGSYSVYNEKKLNLPENKRDWPSRDVLRARLVRNLQHQSVAS